ncbi:hypothetical protein ENUP19_0252G0043 [Entamoeba nuttalli]|uniref:COG1912 domain containing protein n=2 Tax=Entamoeba nuttalli TaxID=412467 RepID=K2HHF3_ENTNP|nr:COG1912 domain containing protein [Entamoeba nuttalli P19]EKE42379.1 COG1912 domain containing protein [Entamoeba nuttalli P19]|eukprot:XP_008855284.1 COG1912 domain containing protein [Entamoeba nuttalli P19]
MKTIALLTDFGYGEYVGIMKGVIAKHCPCLVNIIDISHDIYPQSILQASWILSTAIPFFPDDTVFIAVVDPGVGGDRSAVLIKTKTITLVGPNNGIFTHSLQRCNLEIEHVYVLNVQNASSTFHGRDVFSLNAARFVFNGSINGIESNEKIYQFPLVKTKNIITIVSIDHFGNIISDQEGDYNSIQYIQTQNKREPIHFVCTYEEGAKKGYFLVGLIGSNKTFEISIVNGNAQQYLNVHIGDQIKLIF